MKKILLTALLLFTANIALAEQVPIKLIPAQDISTCHDEIEIGDKILFMAKYSPKLKIQKDTAIIGIVDYVQNNGWGPENAEIQFKKFIITLEDGKQVTYNSSLTINGFEELKYRYPKGKRFFEYIPVFLRGKEIDIRTHKDKPIYNIWVSL